MVLKELQYFLRHPIKSIQNAMGYSELARQHTENFNKYVGVLAEQQETIKELDGLRGKVKGLENSINELAKQKNLLTQELATSQNQIEIYKKGVLESPDYVGLATKKDAIEAKVGDLEKQVSDLNNLCMFRQETIKELRETLRGHMGQYRNTMETIFEKEAENDNKALSYIIIDGDGKIVASTPTFRKNFKYDEIKGTKYFSVLKAPEPNGNAENWIRLTSFLQEQVEDGLESTILDCKRELRHVYLEKQKPTIIQCTEYGENGEGSNYTLVYRRIDVHDIGFWKKFSKEHRERKIRSLEEYFAVLKLDEAEIENKELKKAMKYYSSDLRKRGLNLTQVLRVWDKLRKKERNYDTWKRGCAELILGKRKDARKIREKQAKEEKNQDNPPKTT